MPWSEDRIHRWLATRTAPKVLVGSKGHDAAVLAQGQGHPVMCTDACAEGVHYEAACSARKVGAKAAARALSDLAATAARPHALSLGLCAPRATSEARLRALIDGVDRAGRAFGAALVAGDLSLVPGPERLTVTALGFFTEKLPAPGRDRARAGDVLFLTGPVGGSLLGRHLKIQPRLDEGSLLFAQGARAMLDVSDGLALDLSRLARASGVRARLQHVPIHKDAKRAARRDERSALDHALHDGEDHELIIAVPPRRAASLQADTSKQIPALARIGVLEPGKGLLLDLDTAPAVLWNPRQGGFLHGNID